MVVYCQLRSSIAFRFILFFHILFILQFDSAALQKMITGEEPKFPDTLEGFGYHFDKEGRMRSIEKGEPFNFDVKAGDGSYNQKHYNALGEVITNTVYEMLEKEYKLQRTYLPAQAERDQPRSFVFVSGDLYHNSDKLLILIHGNGVVRAGQWARRLIMNDCLDSGTQFPFIKWARENGYAVIVANPNLNVDESSKPVPIKGHSTPEEHVESMWVELVHKAKAKHIAIVAHSYGGVSTVELAKKRLREFEERVFAIALTDSVHSLREQKPHEDLEKFYKKCVINWASAFDPLDAPLLTDNDKVPTVSAGTDKHEYTSFSSMKSIFKFFNKRYEETLHPEKSGATQSTEPSGTLKKLNLGEGDGQLEEQNFDSTNQAPRDKSGSANSDADKNGNSHEGTKVDVDGHNSDLNVQTDPQETVERKESPKSEL
ncbi:cotranscriptional regulator FAM172A homolog isoform X3 [Dreissena polymorpha]|uniref:cotranscriptional regulator FAM172A homolog isoform X3 n=1 Tax=Dreissena polymorpha TaxID=45954 RepID=UPI002263D183|nr:cotranscriptional regulator FAM172A homolog isoform X3 [Dreissena polymorpha]